MNDEGTLKFDRSSKGQLYRNREYGVIRLRYAIIFRGKSARRRRVRASQNLHSLPITLTDARERADKQVCLYLVMDGSFFSRRCEQARLRRKSSVGLA